MWKMQLLSRSTKPKANLAVKVSSLYVNGRASGKYRRGSSI